MADTSTTLGPQSTSPIPSPDINFDFRKPKPIIFEKDEFWSSEEAMPLDKKRERYVTCDIIRLEDIVPWDIYARSLPLEEPPSLIKAYKDTMEVERNHKKKTTTTTGGYGGVFGSSFAYGGFTGDEEEVGVEKEGVVEKVVVEDETEKGKRKTKEEKGTVEDETERGKRKTKEAEKGTVEDETERGKRKAPKKEEKEAEKGGVEDETEKVKRKALKKEEKEAEKGIVEDEAVKRKRKVRKKRERSRC